jgi:hypothetical protein
MKFRVIADAEFGDSSWAIFGDGISTLRDDFFFFNKVQLDDYMDAIACAVGHQSYTCL